MSQYGRRMAPAPPPGNGYRGQNQQMSPQEESYYRNLQQQEQFARNQGYQGGQPQFGGGQMQQFQQQFQRQAPGPAPRPMLPQAPAPRSLTGNRFVSPSQPTGQNQYGLSAPPVRPPRPSQIISQEQLQQASRNANKGLYQNSQNLAVPSRQNPRYSDISDVPVSPAETAVSSTSIYIGYDPSLADTASPADSTGRRSSDFMIPPPVQPTIQQLPPRALQPPPRRNSGNPPPPVRGGRVASSFYSQTGFVSPIPEESTPGSMDRHGSFASSRVIPSNWGSPAVGSEFSPMNPPDMYAHREDGYSDEDDGSGSISPRPVANMDDEERGLVRQASMGKKSKPKITEIKASNSPSDSKEFGSFSAYGATPSLESLRAAQTDFRSQSKSPYEQAATESQALSRGTTPTQEKRPSSRSSWRFSFAFPRRNSVVQSEKDGSEKSPTDLSRSGSTATKTKKIPPPLDLGAVKAAEARGSLTSLPDLIRRATKLAAVLEHGRPDSRWGYTRNSFTDSSTAGRTDKGDSISDILASFPAPALNQGERGRVEHKRTPTGWPMMPQELMNTEAEPIEQERKKRKMCGLPMWAFVLLILLGLVVVAAAVVVPLQLVMLSRDNDDAPSASDIVSECRQKLTCANGGVNVARVDFCGCVCTGGFSGETCEVRDNDSCVTFTGELSHNGINNATVGSAIPRLFDMSSMFGINLEKALILSKFSKDNKSCVAQNALVTFQGKNGLERQAARRRQDVIFPPTTNMPLPTKIVSDTAPTTSTTTTTETPTVTRTAGRVFQTGLPIADSAIDFARVAVLFLVQNTTYGDAALARERFDDTFGNGVDFGTVDLGNGNRVDFNTLRLTTKAGVTVGRVQG